MKYKDTIETAYNTGLSVREIADRYGLSRESVYQRLRDLPTWSSMKTDQSRRRSLERVSELRMDAENMVEGWLAGVTMEDLAREYKTSRQVVRKFIIELFGSTKRNHRRDLQIVEEYKSGATQVSLAKKYGVSQPCISRIVSALSSQD